MASKRKPRGKATNAAARAALVVNVDVRDACERVASKWLEFGHEALWRAAQFSLNGVAMDATRRFRERVPKVLDRPTQKTLDGIVLYEADKKSLKNIKSLDQVQSRVFVGDLVSIWTKFQFGEGLQRRHAGDVGLSKDSIWVPFWNNIKLTQGVHPDRHGNVPDGFVGRIKREIKGNVSKRRKKHQWRVWEGPFTVKGIERKSVVAAPPREKAKGGAKDEIREAGRPHREVPLVQPIPHTTTPDKVETPRVLFIEVNHADYEPRLEMPWQHAGMEAAASFGLRLDHELESKWAHKRSSPSARNRKGATPQRRFTGGDQSHMPEFFRD